MRWSPTLCRLQTYVWQAAQRLRSCRVDVVDHEARDGRPFALGFEPSELHQTCAVPITPSSGPSFTFDCCETQYVLLATKDENRIHVGFDVLWPRRTVLYV